MSTPDPDDPAWTGYHTRAVRVADDWNATPPAAAPEGGWKVGLYRDHHLCGTGSFSSIDDAVSFHRRINEGGQRPARRRLGCAGSAAAALIVFSFACLALSAPLHLTAWAALLCVNTFLFGRAVVLLGRPTPTPGDEK